MNRRNLLKLGLSSLLVPLLPSCFKTKPTEWVCHVPVSDVESFRVVGEMVISPLIMKDGTALFTEVELVQHYMVARLKDGTEKEYLGNQPCAYQKSGYLIRLGRRFDELGSNLVTLGELELVK